MFVGKERKTRKPFCRHLILKSLWPLAFAVRESTRHLCCYNYHPGFLPCYLEHVAAAKSLQLCPTLRDPIDCSLPVSSVHGVFQARVLEWGAIASIITIIPILQVNKLKFRKTKRGPQVYTLGHDASCCGEPISEVMCLMTWFIHFSVDWARILKMVSMFLIASLL